MILDGVFSHTGSNSVYFDKEKPLPPFENGDYIRYITQGSVLIEYEIIQKQALEFSETEVEE